MFIFMFSLFQVVQEYERAVIFRLGRLLAGGSKGPGKFINMGSFKYYISTLRGEGGQKIPKCAYL